MPVYVLDPSSPTTILSATSTGAGAMFASPANTFGGVSTDLTWQIIVSGGPSALSVTLEGSNDGGNTWAVLDTSTLATGEMRAVANTPVTNLRANLATLTGGTSPKVTVIVQVGQ